MYTERDGRNVFHRSPVDSPDITSSPMPTVPCNVVGARIPMDPIRIFRPPTQTFFHDHLGDGKGGAKETAMCCPHTPTGGDWGFDAWYRGFGRVRAELSYELPTMRTFVQMVGIAPAPDLSYNGGVR